MDTDAVDAMMAQWATERPDLDVSSMGVLARISLAAHLFARTIEREYAQRGLSGASFDVLATLRRAGRPYRLTPTRLYNASRVSSGTMTNRLDQLERAGLVVRLPDPQDRRSLLVELTPQGLAVVDALIAAHAELGQQIVGALPAGERDHLVRGLRRLLLALEEAYRAGE